LPRTPSHNIHARETAFLLGTYPDVLDVAVKTHEPSGVVSFAFKLAHAISAALQSIIVNGEEDLEKARAKMYLYECTREVLAAAMQLLSIQPLERM
jgi:arginyl-tRNA synthetase